MALTLHFHPLSSFCQKALIGLYELDVPFEKRLVDLGDPTARAEFLRLWPLGKFPVLHDGDRDRTVPESTTILEYVDRRQGGGRLVPGDPDRALECRLQDRFFDLYVNTPMGKVVTDRLRPEGEHDRLGVSQARAQLRTAYAIAEEQLRMHRFASGDDFGLADCAAAPSLFFARQVEPFGDQHPHLAGYLERVSARPSVARTFAEAAPYLSLVPR
ncbi:MAG TPA: glutathione S-transferase family protein [Polyangiaceae bacterium]|nr:glutathione S-transferase family protein [Polyangiaceae bacterium]